MKKVIGYIRVSTDKQKNNGISPGDQDEKIRQWATLNGYEIKEILSDLGVSGRYMKNRSKLDGALDALEKGDALVAYSLSRVSRSIRDTLDLVDRIHQKGADLVSLTEKIDTTTPQGELIFHIFAALNQFQRDMTASHVREIMASKRDRGEKTGGWIPFGFDVVEESRGDKVVKKIVANEEEQDVINAIRMMAEKKWKASKIAWRLNQEDIKTKCGRRWTKTQVIRILARIRDEQAPASEPTASP